LIVGRLPEIVDHRSGDSPQPLLIVQRLGEGLGGAQVVEAPTDLGERDQCPLQVEPEVDGLLVCGAIVGEMGHGR